MALGEPDTTATAAGPGAAGEDWAVTATDSIVRAVDTVRAKTTGPAITVARGVVYGLLAVLLGIGALVLGAIGFVRALDAYLPDAVFGDRHTWAAHGLVGAVFSLVGLLLWSKRGPNTHRR